ncbi:MAG: amidohydrolase family protein [Oscillospiraceae bacterium]|nr:amidohydrolase family protein [Oscillospiraceae bacterium]
MIIDFHTHAFPERIAMKAMEKLSQTSKIPYYGDGTLSATLSNLDKSGADKAVILPIATRPDNLRTLNDYAAAHDGRISGNPEYARFIQFGTVHPDTPDVLEELCRIKSLGLPGVKLHPDYQGFFINEEKLYPIYEKISQLGLICIFHAGFDPVSPDLIHADPRESAKVLERFPEMKVVLAHMGGMYQFELVDQYLAGKFKNLWLDTAIISGNIEKELLMRIIKKQGAGRILFASDFPWHETANELSFIRSLPLEDGEKELILGKNAMELLGL